MVLIFGLGFAGLLGLIGYLIRYRQHYYLIAGYNRASRVSRQQYDIQGLAAHLGNGLITLAVLVALSSVLFYLALETLAMIAMALFIAVAFLIVLGGKKFTPSYQNLLKRAPHDAATMP